MKTFIFVSVLFLSVYAASAQTGRIDPCIVFGKIYVETNRVNADFKVYVEENDAFAHLAVYKQANKFFADKAGQWYFTNIRSEADFWIYFEHEKGRSDFSIAYIVTESFAGCK
jgi:hypothetical protein